jgi:ceramide glucosyltransferase
MTSVLAVLAALGVIQVLAGWALTARFAWTMRQPARVPAAPITVLKPLYGAEPLLDEALESLAAQDYPPGFQIVCGVTSAGDTAIAAVARLQARHPGLDIVLVIDPARHGSNPKVGNLINMLPAARHDILAIADSDVHVRPDYLRRLAEALSWPNTGLATVLYTGLPAFRCLAGLLGATQITHGFLPGALLARALGRRDCLGATMCLRRETLAAVGGFAVLRDHLADDNMLGRLVRARGEDVALARTVVATTVPERTFGALWRHELRWARTIRTLEPVGFAASLLQHSFLWAFLALIVSPLTPWTWALAAFVWAVRVAAATSIDRALSGPLGGLAFGAPVWLLPVRDLISAAEWIASHAGRRVDWRGLTLRADTPPSFTGGSTTR